MKIFLRKILSNAGLLDLSINLRNRIVHLPSAGKWKRLKKQNVIFLELGSGAKKGANGWVTVDLSGSDINYDLRNGIPLPSGCVDKIYTSHMLEHIPYKELISFVNECYRVLKNNGELLVCVPDAGKYIKSYINGTQFLREDQLYGPAKVETNSLIDQINYIAYMDGHHKYMFDNQGLINTLKKAPFRTVGERGFDSSLDLKSRDHESIYAIAVK